jgi:glycine cleavage system H protein
MTKVPSDLRYAKTHEWVRIAGEYATVGITDHAQHELTDVVFVELPQNGRKLKAGESCAVVESVKTASDIYTPISGEITAINDAVVANPALVNTDPYGEGWFFKLKMTNPQEAQSLLSGDDYGKQVNS